MRWPSIPAALLTVALATSTLAAPTLPGINIRWDNCFSAGGVMNKAFACDTNTGSELAVLSLQLDTGMADASGVEIRIAFKSAASELPAWWEFLNTGSCRISSLRFVDFPTLPDGSCADWGQGLEVGGALASYSLGEIGSGSAAGHMISCVLPSNLARLDPGTEYVVGGLTLSHAKTVGAGACGGCDVPMCILFSVLKVTTPVYTNDRLFTQGANGADSQIIHWQNGGLVNLVNQCSSPFTCDTQFDCLVATSTAARHSTWGAVKALYR